MTVEELIKYYLMLPHPEGGWFKETYRSNEIFPGTALPERFGGNREFSTAIYFLLEKNNFSAFHRIKSDECRHFYTGDPLEIFILSEKGKMDRVVLGNEISKGQCFQYVVPANSWFASRTMEGGAFSFVGCTVSPGFDFQDFEMADPVKLALKFPAYSSIFRAFTKQEEL